MAQRAVVLMGHGSRDPRGAQEFLQLAEMVAAELAEPVYAGVLEFAGPVAPSIQDAFDRAAGGGATEVVGQPVLLFPAGHDRWDMPAEVRRARDRHPGIRYRLGQALGVHEALLDLVAERAREAAARLPRGDASATAVLLVGRGSTVPAANAELFRIARLLWEQGPWGWVEAAFVSLTGPSVAEGIRRCACLGARRVLVVPYFLCTGVLVHRIYRQAWAERARHPGLEIACGAHLGVDPRVARAVRERLGQAAEAPLGTGSPGALESRPAAGRGAGGQREESR